MKVSNLDIYLKNIDYMITHIMSGRLKRIPVLLDSNISKLYSQYKNETDPKIKCGTGARMLNAYENNPWVMLRLKSNCAVEDMRLFMKHHKDRTLIDKSPSKPDDYYSVAVIVKNEARYIKEFILFYQSTGADRIYIYDNESTDGLSEVLEPFINAGQVVYKKWPGNKVQTAAYRDAVRRTRKRTKWLALVDADEFLFPMEGDMKTLLKEYEEYPGIGVNWRMFGPNGHDKRPEGLVMDNYTECIANEDEVINQHIKSIVQPSRVALVNHVHFAMYKNKQYAVDENKVIIDNTCAHAPSAGKAFTPTTNGRIFRINHYNTRSLEDLREKCERGYPDGTPKGTVESFIRTFDRPLKHDYSIKRFADIVRESIG